MNIANQLIPDFRFSDKKISDELKYDTRQVYQVYGVMTEEPDPQFPDRKIKVMLWGDRRPREKKKYKCFSDSGALIDFCNMNNIKPIKAK